MSRARKPVIAAVVFACVLALASGATAAPVLTGRNSVEPTLVERINEVRASHGLGALRVSEALTKAATRHARSMALAGYFKHELYTPEGGTAWTPFGRWIGWYFPGPGYVSWSAGENLAWGAPDLAPSRTVTMWMNSPGHRANLLKTGWRRVGVAIVHVRDPHGYFRSWGHVTIAVAEFGQRS